MRAAGVLQARLRDGSTLSVAEGTLIPLLLIWLGTGGPFMLTISALGAYFPIVINTLLGVRQCDPGLLLAARDLGPVSGRREDGNQKSEIRSQKSEVRSQKSEVRS